MTPVARAAISAGTLSAAGRGVAQVAGERAAALDLRRADQVQRLDHARPGACSAPAWASTIDAGRRGADDEAAAFLADADDAGDLLGVDDQVGLQPAGAHLHQQVGAARTGPSRGRRRRPRSLTASSTVVGAA